MSDDTARQFHKQVSLLNDRLMADQRVESVGITRYEVTIESIVGSDLLVVFPSNQDGLLLGVNARNYLGSGEYEADKLLALVSDYSTAYAVIDGVLTAQTQRDHLGREFI